MDVYLCVIGDGVCGCYIMGHTKLLIATNRSNYEAIITFRLPCNVRASFIFKNSGLFTIDGK